MRGEMEAYHLAVAQDPERGHFHVCGTGRNPINPMQYEGESTVKKGRVMAQKTSHTHIRIHLN